MKIVHVIAGSSSIGGAQTHVRDLVAGLAARGHACTVLVGPPDGLFCDQLRDLGIEVKLLSYLEKALHPVRDSRALLELVQALKQLKPDIVAAHTAKAGFLGRLSTALLRTPCVFTPHGLSIVDRATGKINPVYMAIERIGGFLGGGMIAVCRDEQQLAASKGMMAREKIFMVHNGIPDRDPAPEMTPRPRTDEPVLLMIARFQEQKDHGSLLQALALLKEFPWRLQLAGSGPLLEKTRELAASLGIAERVDFLGERADAPELLEKASIFVLSTFWEAFPISILEAMRAGLPVATTQVGGVGEAVVDGSNGFLIPVARPDLLAEKLKLLITDADLRERLGAQARKDYLSFFTAEQMVDRTLEVYGALTAHETTASLEKSPDFSTR